MTKKRKSISTFMNGNQTETINHCLSVNVNKKCKCIDRDFGITNQFCQTTYEKLFHYSIFCWVKKWYPTFMDMEKLSSITTIALLCYNIQYERVSEILSTVYDFEWVNTKSIEKSWWITMLDLSIVNQFK